MAKTYGSRIGIIHTTLFPNCRIQKELTKALENHLAFEISSFFEYYCKTFFADVSNRYQQSYVETSDQQTYLNFQHPFT